jgi:hypothetical protein
MRASLHPGAGVECLHWNGHPGPAQAGEWDPGQPPAKTACFQPKDYDFRRVGQGQACCLATMYSYPPSMSMHYFTLFTGICMQETKHGTRQDRPLLIYRSLTPVRAVHRLRVHSDHHALLLKTKSISPNDFDGLKASAGNAKDSQNAVRRHGQPERHGLQHLVMRGIVRQSANQRQHALLVQG